MKAIHNKSLFIFRRDLHIDDNKGLLAATEQSEQVLPCFIIDGIQVKKVNSYRSLNAIQFMQQALEDLQEQFLQRGGKLYLFFGHIDEILEKLINTTGIEAIYVNRDYTPFSVNRDENIKKICLSKQITFYQYNDLLLTEPEEIKTSNNEPYSIFTPFFKKASINKVEEPRTLKAANWYKQSIKESLSTTAPVLDAYQNDNLHVIGTHTAAMNILKNIKKFADYENTRNIPSLETTNLSAYNKFGLVSIRQVYHTIYRKLGHNPLLRQLYWRDFFTHIAYFSPFVFGQPFKDRYATLPWENDTKKFKLWCNGTTGFPIIDAGMRQLNETGYMHNRVRLLTGSFLVKDLHIDWQWGEKYFAQHLVDYDPSVNNGNWQWVASTGTDSQLYFRIFNPWLQQKKFDPDCLYIKKWVPELKDTPAAIIHNWYKNPERVIKKYPKPMVNHKTESSKTKKIYKDL